MNIEYTLQALSGRRAFSLPAQSTWTGSVQYVMPMMSTDLLASKFEMKVPGNDVCGQPRALEIHLPR